MLASSLQDLDLHSDKEWQHILTQPSLALETLLTLETEYSMKHYVYIEIVLQWVIANKPSQEVIAALWGSVRHKELNYEYVDGFRESLLSCNEDYQIQEVEEEPASHYKYTDYATEILPEDLELLLEDKPVKIMLDECFMRTCEAGTDLISYVQLTEGVPCYKQECELGDLLTETAESHCHPGAVVHWWVEESNLGTERNKIISLVTHSCGDVKKLISAGMEEGECEYSFWCLIDESYKSDNVPME